MGNHTCLYKMEEPRTNVNNNVDDYVQPYHHPVPPYGLPLGPPYIVTKQNILYKENNDYLTGKTRWKFIKRMRLEQQLLKCFPLIYVLTHSACLILNSVIQIVLQIILMSLNGSLYFVAAGIWCGVYFLITAGITLLLGKICLLYINISIFINFVLKKFVYSKK